LMWSLQRASTCMLQQQRHRILGLYLSSKGGHTDVYTPAIIHMQFLVIGKGDEDGPGTRFGGGGRCCRHAAAVATCSEHRQVRSRRIELAAHPWSASSVFRFAKSTSTTREVVELLGLIRSLVHRSAMLEFALAHPTVISLHPVSVLACSPIFVLAVYIRHTS